jgi:hypothetical protein
MMDLQEAERIDKGKSPHNFCPIIAHHVGS